MLRTSRNSGFTLIELLVVTVVIISLMGIVFRLTGIVGGAGAKERTVSRMQRLENCLSGYYAAFGSYPPVPLQGASRDIYRRANVISQYPNDAADNSLKENTSFSDGEMQMSILAACKAQPVRAKFPPPGEIGGMSSERWYMKFQNDVSKALSDGLYDEDEEREIRKWIRANLTDVNKNSNQFNGKENVVDFNKLPLFRFGLMSFLLPRYKFMIGCMTDKNGKYKGGGFQPDGYRQWMDYNPLPPRMDSGVSFESWEKFAQETFGKNEWQIDLIPSQGVCARWLPNLVDPNDGHIVSGASFSASGLTIGDGWVIPSVENAANFRYSLHSVDGYSSDGVNTGYGLYFSTVMDGWSRDFFYYSPAPYQSYQLWSSGKDGMTFPPWVDLHSLNSDNRAKAIAWMSDDIKCMGTGK